MIQRLLRGALPIIANTALGSALGFVFWVVAARVMPPVEVGLGSAYVAAALTVAAATECGLGTLVLRFVPSLAADEGRRLVEEALGMLGTATLLGALVFALGTPLWAPELGGLAADPWKLGAFLLATTLGGVGVLLDRLFVASGRPRYVLLRNLPMAVLRLGGITVLGWMGAWGLLGSFLLGALGGCLLGWWGLLPRALGYLPRPAVGWRQVRARLGYTLGSHAAQLAWNAPALLYPLIIVRLLGPEANARFYIAWMVANLLLIVPNGVFLVALTEPSGESLLRLVAIICLLLLPGVGALWLGAPLVLRVFGPGYREAAGILSLLAGSALPYTVTSALITHHRLRLRTGKQVRDALLVVGAALSLSTILGKEWGLAGVGWGWLLAHLGGSLLALPMLREVMADENYAQAAVDGLAQPGDHRA